jgi:hypothetical protein
MTRGLAALFPGRPSIARMAAFSFVLLQEDFENKLRAITFRET